MKKILFLIALFTLMGGANSVKAATVKVYSTGLDDKNGACKFTEGTNKFEWWNTSNNTIRAIDLTSGMPSLTYFSSIHFTTSGLASGSKYRVIVQSGSNNYQKVFDSEGTKSVNIADLEKQYDWMADLTPEIIAAASSVRIGGVTKQDGSTETTPLDYLTIDPTSFYIETSWETMSIGSAADWNAFSWFVANGKTFDAELTNNISTSVMVGTSANPYSGTFDGNGYKLTIAYNTTEDRTAPFRYVNNATIQNLKVDGTIESSKTLIGGIVGEMNGTTTIDNCHSSVAITSTKKSDDCNCGGIAAISIKGALISVTNCLFDGSITASGADAYCGIVGYLRDPVAEGTHIVKNNLVLGTLTGAMSTSGHHSSNFLRSYASVTRENNYYKNKFVDDTDGTRVTDDMLASGQVAYDLQGEQATQHWGQDLKAVSSSPMLTSVETYKVYKIGDSYYANQWNNTINDDIDWVTFSKLVASGSTTINVTLNADVDAGSTMVGTSTNPYQGTFDGAGHTLTFTYDGSTSNEIAPFQYINNATINNLTTAGSINAQNIFGGIVGTAGGASTLNYCTSNMVLTANDNGDSNNGRVAGFVGRCADNATPVGTSITFNNCKFGGSISSTIGSRCCGLVSWARSTTVTANNCLIAPTSVTNGAENIAATGGTGPVVKPTNCYYTKKFGWSDQGTLATSAQIASGELCYILNENAVPSTTYFFGQGYLNSSRVEDAPSLTSDASKKVYKDTGASRYANAGGMLPDPALNNGLAWKFENTPSADCVYLLPAEKASNYTLYGASDTYLLRVTSAKATTLVLPFDVANVATGIGAEVKAYKLTLDGTTVNADPVTSIKADEPVLINAPEGDYPILSGKDNNFNFNYAENHTETTSGNLKGVYNTTLPFSYVPAGNYVLQNGEEGLGFYQVETDNTIKITSFRAYLTVTGELAARSLRIVYNDSITDVNEVKAQDKKQGAKGVYYNLSGQRVSKPTKGLYIVDGKVVSF